MMNVQFRRATVADVPAMFKIIEDAKGVMSVDHNPQWTASYPSEATVMTDVVKGYAYVLDLDGEVVATATLWQDGEDSYKTIKGGRWQYRAKQHPYAVIHRVAVSFQHQGLHLSTTLFEGLFAAAKTAGYDYLRVDTHARNKKMQRILLRNGFTQRGVISVGPGPDGERLAFDFVLTM